MKSHRIKGRVAGLVLSVLASLAMAGQSQASVVGDPVEPEFNYASVFIGSTLAGDLDELVIKPPAAPLKLNGSYSGTNGDFTVPKETGFVFPPVELDLDVVRISAEIGLTEDGTGHYDESTGAMDLDLKLSLLLGIDDLEALSEEIGTPLGTGGVKCKLAPLAVEFKTSAGWPHSGKAFEDKTALTDGALAGVWRTKPPIVAVEGDQSVCNIIGGFLKPVGGIWLANSSTEIETWPPPEPPKCPPGMILKDNVCEQEWPHPCGGCNPGSTVNLKGLKLKPNRKKLKAGGSQMLLVSIRNTGDAATTRTINFKSGNSRVRVQPALSVTIPADSTVSRRVKVRAGGKAKGRAAITASVAGLRARTSLVIVRPAKRR